MFSSLNLNFLIVTPLILGAFSAHAMDSSSYSDNNVEISSLSSKIESLNQEKKINKSLFLPELSINTGIGTQRLIDNLYETDKGPYLFIDGKINLYRGGRDSTLQNKTELLTSISKIDREIKKRNLNIEAFKIVTEINFLVQDNQLIQEELNRNKTEQAMANKKVSAGLTTSVDLLDFDLKKENLNNELEKNNLKKEELEKTLVNLFGTTISLQSLLENYSTNYPKDSLIDPNIEESPAKILSAKQTELSNLDKKNYQAEYLPTIDLEAKWGQITPQEKFFNSDKREHQVALNLNIPLFSGFSTSGKIQQAVIEAAQVNRQARQTENDLKSKKEIELKKIGLLKRILSSLEKSISVAQKYRELTIGEYKRGVKNSPDVVSASDKSFELQRKILETRNEFLTTTYSFNETFKSYKGE